MKSYYIIWIGITDSVIKSGNNSYSNTGLVSSAATSTFWKVKNSTHEGSLLADTASKLSIYSDASAASNSSWFDIWLSSGC